MRCFIALNLSETSLNQIELLIQALKRVTSQNNVKWVKSQNIHLTLQFLGEIKAESIPLIQSALDEIAKTASSFTLNALDIGYFPTKRRPQVIALKTDVPLELKSLVENIHKAMMALGYKEDRFFKSHITLARCHGHVKTDLVFPFEPIRLPIDSFSLIQSTLLPTGAQYTILAEYTVH